MAEILALETTTKNLHRPKFRVGEIILVHDGGTEPCAETARELARSSDLVRVVWLSRNFGQHAATIAGFASTTSDWVVTLDEDGQFNPADCRALLFTALERRVPLVYGTPENRPPHTLMRNLLSRLTKKVASRLLIDRRFTDFSSFRLILGEIARGVSAYAGQGIYLDVALHWSISDFATVPVIYRAQAHRTSSYSRRQLLSHFWRLVISSGTRPLRLASIVGVLAASLGVGLAILIVMRRLLYGFPVGFTSVFVLLLLIGGAILISLGIVAEYIGVLVRSVVGRPLYLTQSDPMFSALNTGEPPPTSNCEE